MAKPSDRLRKLEKEVKLVKEKRKELTKIQKIQQRDRDR